MMTTVASATTTTITNTIFYSKHLKGSNNSFLSFNKLHQRRLLLTPTRATAPNTGKESKSDEKGEEDQKLQEQSVSLSLEDVNPVGLGRRSRQLFDEVWRKFSGLGQISRTIRDTDEYEKEALQLGPMCEFAIPGAQNTTVLVVGATSRIGRILVRKLMLRGYAVKVFSKSFPFLVYLFKENESQSMV